MPIYSPAATNQIIPRPSHLKQIRYLVLFLRAGTWGTVILAHQGYCNFVIKTFSGNKRNTFSQALVIDEP